MKAERNKEEKKGFATTTYCVNLYCSHLEWIKMTKEYYDKILFFYYNFLLSYSGLLELSNRDLLRKLEILTIGSKKEQIEPKCPLPYEKIPLYFRRAAINSAIGMVRSYFTRLSNWKAGKEKGKPNIAVKINASPVFYKGMYRKFEKNGIELKLWNGEKWVWESCSFEEKRNIQLEKEKILSPLVKVTKNGARLHIPFQLPVEDARSVKERLHTEKNICAISFPNNDNLAVLAVLNLQGECKDTYFIKGGSEFFHKKKYILGKIEKSRSAMGSKGKSMEDFPHYREKLKNINEHYAHLTSRKIVNYCLEKEIKLIVVPNYGEPIDLNSKSYLKATSYDWIGRKIIQYTKYKAFKQGIMVTFVNPKHTADLCHICNKTIRRFNEGYKPGYGYLGGKKYICEEGHQGNSAFNTAVNLGNKFLEQNKSCLEMDR